MSFLIIGLNEFIHERETKPATDPAILVFDQVILAKRNRSRDSFFGGRSATSFLADTSDHLWRTAAATPPTGSFPGDYRAIVTRSKSNQPFSCLGPLPARSYWKA